ncbi:hypothetical protein [Natrialba sp. PRR66]|uniref:hypothetical protein n=1 Tax=Natrialba sp. PRR66 TaxID=3098146 RepID=UPI002B1D73E1|nr:hypothetical protein [Natrialba sp. PRR66]
MISVQFYGVLATTASIFVGILTAYLVTRLSDLKSERARLRRRIESIDAELRVLRSRHGFRMDWLEETENRWEQESAEENVDNFIEFNVGDEWDPHPDDVSVGDAIDGMLEHRDMTEEDLIQHHLDTVEERWDEIIDKIQPRDPFLLSSNISDAVIESDAYTAAGWITDALWEIYDREKYNSNNAEVMNIRRKASQLESERDVLVEQYETLNPKQLNEGIRATIVPITLSVILPIFVRFLHELGWVITVPSILAFIEPIIVLIAWFIGFFWTLYFVWERISNGDDELPNSPLSQESLGE